MNTKPHFVAHTKLQAKDLNHLADWSSGVAGRMFAATACWGLIHPAWESGETNIIQKEGNKFAVRNFWFIDVDGRLFHSPESRVEGDPGYGDLVLRRKAESPLNYMVPAEFYFGMAGKDDKENFIVARHAKGPKNLPPICWSLPALTLNATPQLTEALRLLNTEADFNPSRPQWQADDLAMVRFVSALPGAAAAISVYAELLSIQHRRQNAHKRLEGHHPTVLEIVSLCEDVRSGLKTNAVKLKLSGEGYWEANETSDSPISHLRLDNLASETGVEAYIGWAPKNSTKEKQMQLSPTNAQGHAGERYAEWQAPHNSHSFSFRMEKKYAPNEPKLMMVIQSQP